MKANSRRRVLISSMCMLLVALVALSTATFAWFTNNKQVTANGMSVQAAAAKGLQITGTNGGVWGPSHTFTTAGITLTPATVGYTASDAYGKMGTPYAPGDVKEAGAWTDSSAEDAFINWATVNYPTVGTATIAGDTQGTFKDAVYYETTNASFAAYRVGVRSTGSDITNATMTVSYKNDATDTTHDASSFIRVAVLKQDGTAPVITGTGADTVMTVLGDEAVEAVTAIKDATIYAGTPEETTVKVVDTTATQKVDGNTATVDLSGVTIDGDGQYFTILVWYEGQDDECVDANQQAVGNIDIQFKYV